MTAGGSESVRVGVEDGVAGDQAEVADGVFTVLLSGDDGGDGGLRAGSGGGGNGDKERERAANLQESAELGDGLIGADDAGRGDLCRVDGRAAAEDEEAVAAVGAVLRGELLNGGDARVGLNAGKDGWADTAPLERGAQGEEALVRALAAAGDDEGARGALARKDVGELQQAARAAKDSGRAPRQEPRAEGEAALEGTAGESLERHGPTSLS